MTKFNEKYLTRQRDLISQTARQSSICIVGAGAIGSWVALSLAKMGYHNMFIVDDDVVDDVNMNCQFFPITAIGQHKVTATYELIKQFVGVEIKHRIDRLVSTENIPCDFLILGVDSMSARKQLAGSFRGNYIIDGRMGSESMSCFVIDNKNTGAKKIYLDSMYSDDEAVQEACTGKSTIYCANTIASLICNAVKRVSMGQDYAPMQQFDMKTLSYAQTFLKGFV